MTNKKKIELLEKMRVSIEEGISSLCSAYYGIRGNFARENTLKSLGLIKPKKTYNSEWWFKPFDSAPRIRLFKRAIKTLKEK